MKLSGWAKHPKINTKLHRPNNINELSSLVSSGDLIARGNGRSYGDSSVSLGNTIDMRSFNRLISFDENSGRLVAESGVILGDVIKTFFPKGWFPAVVPGTKFVTLGGMVAADVHGKNHHLDGSFGGHIDWLDIVCADGKLRRCSPTSDPELFRWTIGGMGLTGIIVRLAFRLQRVSSGWIKQKTMIAKNISEVMEFFEKYKSTKYSVAWIDCLQSGRSLGRSVIMLGEHSDKNELQKDQLRNVYPAPAKALINISLNCPAIILNRWTARIFNFIYFWKAKLNQANKNIDWNSYFFPLDTIINWNRLYGKRGFLQFQCVIPIDRSRDAMERLLIAIAQSNTSPFLAVLKKLGHQDSHFSFPMHGYTLAVDFPANEKTFNLMKMLELIVLEYGGRFYLAKEACMSRHVFEKSDQRIEKFRHYRKKTGVASTFMSAQSSRLGL